MSNFFDILAVMAAGLFWLAIISAVVAVGTVIYGLVSWMNNGSH